MFGKSKAGVILQEILLKEDMFEAKKLRKKMVTMFNEYCAGLKELRKVNCHRERMIIIWRNDFLKNIENLNLRKNLHTHFRNSIHAVTKDYLRETILQNPKLGKYARKIITEAHIKRHKEYKEYVTTKIDSN